MPSSVCGARTGLGDLDRERSRAAVGRGRGVDGSVHEHRHPVAVGGDLLADDRTFAAPTIVAVAICVM